MVGTARKNENSAAAVLESFWDIPPTILAPLLETPGIIAKHWKKPIFNAVEYEISVFSESPNQSSTFKRIKPPITSETATVIGFSNNPSIQSLNNNPKTTAGRKATSNLK